MADELEEQGRELMRHARTLQRLAERIESGPSAPPRRSPPEGRGGRRPEERGGPPREGETKGRPKRKQSGEAPPWAPTGKRRRS
ncbi:MAG TPA: hypothetical protein VFL93_09520 [Longimicrobiaceae bacterium]|jgi:hypothetical protein|nr:hypothetical protein [Longimicrobiaceae bacterium]